MAELTQEQLRSITRQILRSWKFWALLVVVVGAAGLGVVALAQRIIDLRSAQYLNALQQKAASQSAAISGQISNQLLLEFQQPRIQAAVERVAREHAQELFTNSVWPSLEAFQASVDQARAQLARSSNQLVALDRQIKGTGQKLTNPVTASNAPRPAAPAANSAKLILMDHSVSMHGNNYVLSLNFKKPGGAAIGAVELIAGTYKQTAKILNFASLLPDLSQPPVYSPDGDAAQMDFIGNADETTVILELSAPTIVRVTGDSLEGDLTLPVAAEKIHLSTPIAGGQ